MNFLSTFDFEIQMSTQQNPGKVNKPLLDVEGHLDLTIQATSHRRHHPQHQHQQQVEA